MGDDVSRRKWQHHTRVWNFALTYASYSFRFPHTRWSEYLRSCLLSNKGHRHLPNFKGDCPQGNHIIIDNESLNLVKLQSTLIHIILILITPRSCDARVWQTCWCWRTFPIDYVHLAHPPSPPTKIAKFLDKASKNFFEDIRRTGYSVMYPPVHYTKPLTWCSSPCGGL